MASSLKIIYNWWYYYIYCKHNQSPNKHLSINYYNNNKKNEYVGQ